MITDVRMDDFPQIYSDLVHHFDRKPWMKTVENLQYQVKANSLMEDWILRVYKIAYGLVEFDKFGLGAAYGPKWESVKHAMGFAAQVLAILDVSTPDNARKAIARVDGALRKPDTMRGIEFEFSIATHLSRMGCTIEWKEEDKPGKNFDMLVNVPGMGLVDFECKTLASDTGEAIPEDIALEFINRLMPWALKALPDLPRHFYGISITMECAIPSGVDDQAQLALAVGEVLARTDHHLEGICRIDLQGGGLSTLPAGMEDQALRSLSNFLLGDHPSYQFITELPDGSHLAIRVGCVIPSTLNKQMKKKAKTAIRKQMTGERPGCLVMRVERHSAEDLTAEANADENDLFNLAKYLCEHPEHPHLAGVVFVSAPALTRLSSTTESGQSCTYAFDSLWGNYPNLGFKGLFADQ
ncbi:hypothetical protein ACYSUW_14135 [Pseudomonas frederiksbergensis]